MNDTTKATPPERSSEHEIKQDFLIWSKNDCSHYFDHFAQPLLVINHNRQIVFANKAFLHMAGNSAVQDLLGHRPGEIFHCAYAKIDEGGCGTSDYCKECSAYQAVLKSINTGSPTTGDCQLLQTIDGKNRALDLKVNSSPTGVNGKKFYILTITDISDEKKREAMERIFFHDILNSAGSATNLINLLHEKASSNQKELLDLLSMSIHGLIEDVQTHKELNQLESGNFRLSLSPVHSFEIVRSVAREFRLHPAAARKQITIITPSDNCLLETDRSLIRRALINMLKNALEATPQGGEVKIGCRSEQNSIVFEVHNDQVMDESVQLQIFKRSFSTKGKGRGLGTYSIKILMENYLNGQVSFISNKEVGTVFKISLPTT